MCSWSPLSWQKFQYEHAPNYPDIPVLNATVEQLSRLPPLVTSGEVTKLKNVIAKAGRGEAFILQGGDCSETFEDCSLEIINKKLLVLAQMSLILKQEMAIPITCIGRIAGQYAKPRSRAYETINGVTLPSYCGDLINSSYFDKHSRIPNPKLLLEGYHCAAKTLRFINALLDSEYSDHWNLAWVKKEFSLSQSAGSAEFMNVFGNFNSPKIDFFTSHEALNLHYESALTRRMPDNYWYNLSTHLPWIGMRTAKLESAHLELLRGVQNPIGIKLGPDISKETVVELVKIINPHREEGRVLLISRLGATKIAQQLPALIEAVRKANWPVTWCCDPMHGNTEFTTEGIKTRHFDTILLELQQAVKIHHEMDSWLGGVHFELCAENVTECLGGSCGISKEDLKKAYYSLVDPRLNYTQSLEIATQLSHQLKSLKSLLYL